MPEKPTKKYYLGFMSYCSHDPSAAMVKLTKDSQQITCDFIHFEEGMLSRKKKSYHFPSRAIKACLDYFNIEMTNIDSITTDFMDLKSFINTSYNYRHLIGDYIRNNLNIRPHQISKNVDHHTAHAMSAWVGSGYKECALIAIDGLGSSQSTHSVFVAENGDLKKIFSQTTPGIGALYTLITELIGFKAGEEGKTMGLAPYGRILKERKKFPLIDFKGVYNSLSIDYSEIINRSPNKQLLTDFDYNKYKKFNIYEDYRAYLAFCVQEELEKCMLHLVNQIQKITGKTKLCLAGGVALNCVANEIIANSKIFESTYVFPDSADSGLAVGLAFSAVKQDLTKSEWNNLLQTYRHPKFAPSESISKVNSKTLINLPWKKLDTSAVIEALERNSVIAVFWEGFEYGPRALGHRSFIANAASPKMKEILNTKIKHREAYRPFAPICLAEDFSSFFESSHLEHEFMSYAVKAKSAAIDLVPSVVHHDGTARVQIATKDCGLIYELLNLWKVKNGCGILINTSLNDNDEPIVLDELDALSCFLRTNCDMLILNEKMLDRSSVQSQINEISKKIETEIKQRNDIRFNESLKAILKNKAIEVKKYLKDYQVISSYHKEYSTFIKLHKLILMILNNEREKIDRLLISEREVGKFNNILEYLYCDQKTIANTILVIPDNSRAIILLNSGDFILSYNLSNLLRDYKDLGLIETKDFEIFYESSDFPIPDFSNSHVNANESISLLAKSYENINSLDIESAFR
jgi:carbamoyltransferase